MPANTWGASPLEPLTLCNQNPEFLQSVSWNNRMARAVRKTDCGQAGFRM